MEIIAHRGSSHKYGDNTMEAFKHASELRCSIEMDVQITMDKVIICSHNPYCKKTGLMTYKRNYDRHEDVALHDVFSEVEVPCFIFDIKDTRCNSDMVVNLINLVIKYKIIHKCIFASFNEFHLRDICEQEKIRNITFRKAYITGNLNVDMFEYKIQRWSLSYIIIYKFQLNKEFVSFVKKYNIKVYVYTCNSEGTFQYCEYCECDGVISDIPEKFV